MKRLSRHTLAQLDARVQRPAYDAAAVSTGIVHLGLGNFHRSHQAVYTDSVLARDPRWGICGVSMKSRGVDEHGKTIDVRDPLSQELASISCVARDSPAALFRHLLRLRAIFGDDLPRSAAFRHHVLANLASLFERGAHATLQRLSNQRHRSACAPSAA